MADANPFDKFDPADSPAGGGGSPFDRFDPADTDASSTATEHSFWDPPKRTGMTGGMAGKERAVYGMGQGIVGMGVGLGQRFLPTSVSQSAPFRAVQDWATGRPTIRTAQGDKTDVAQVGGRIVGPAFVGGPAAKAISAGAKALPVVSRAVPAISDLAAQFPRTTAALTGGATAGLTTPFEKTPQTWGEAAKQSVWPAVAGAGLGGVAASIGRSPVTQKVLDYGVRLTPGRMLPGGQRLEDFVAKIPGLNQVVGAGWRTTRDDAQRAFYNYAVQPLGIRVSPNHPLGEGGLRQLRTTIGNRYNTILSRAQFRSNASFDNTISRLRNNNQATLSSDDIRKFERVYADEVQGRLNNNNQVLTGQQLAGDGGALQKIRNRMNTAYKNQDTALGQAYRNLATAIEDHANFGAPGARQAFQSAREAYARFSTLRSAAGRKADSRGYLDPESVLAELKSGNKPAFVLGQTFGHGDLQQMAQNMYDAGVPTVGRGGEVAPISTQDVGLAGAAGIGSYLSGIHPSLGTAALAGAGAAVPASLYTQPGMTGLADLARQNPAALGIGFGGVGGRAQQTYSGQ